MHRSASLQVMLVLYGVGLTTFAILLPSSACQPEDHTAPYVLLAAGNESRYIAGTTILPDGRLTILV
jgi:hypothetical protein